MYISTQVHVIPVQGKKELLYLTCFALGKVYLNYTLTQHLLSTDTFLLLLKNKWEIEICFFDLLHFYFIFAESIIFDTVRHLIFFFMNLHYNAPVDCIFFEKCRMFCIYAFLQFAYRFLQIKIRNIRSSDTSTEVAVRNSNVNVICPPRSAKLDTETL